VDGGGYGRRGFNGREDLDLVADAEPGGNVLCDGEVDVGGLVDSLKRRQLRASIEILAGVNVRDADAGAKRREDRLASDDGLRPRDLGERDVPLGARTVHL